MFVYELSGCGFESRHSHLGHSLLQTDAGITKWDIFITKWVKHYYKAGYLCVITKWQEKLQNGTVNLLQKWGNRHCKEGHVLKKATFFQSGADKLGQELLQSGVIYYKVGQYLL